MNNETNTNAYSTYLTQFCIKAMQERGIFDISLCESLINGSIKGKAVWKMIEYVLNHCIKMSTRIRTRGEFILEDGEGGFEDQRDVWARGRIYFLREGHIVF